jgi:hypothetical protein
MQKHLRRLERVWIGWPIYFITTCTLERRPILASKDVAATLIKEWQNAHDRHNTDPISQDLSGAILHVHFSGNFLLYLP